MTPFGHRFLLLFLVVLLPGMLFAAVNPTGLGAVAGNLMEPVEIVSAFVSTSSIILGGSFLFASVIKYSQHRINPLAVPISTVVLLVVMGIILVVLPLAYKLTDSGFQPH